jgi:membrane associated rhomboid family serine protease
MAYYAIMFPMSRIGFCFRFSWARISYSSVGVHWLTLPAFLAFFFFIGLQILGASSQMSGYGGINYLGHLGGIVVGVFAAFMSRFCPSALFQKPVPAEAPSTPEPEKTEPPKYVSQDYNPDDYKR